MLLVLGLFKSVENIDFCHYKQVSDLYLFIYLFFYLYLFSFSFLSKPSYLAVSIFIFPEQENVYLTLQIIEKMNT